jgi:hypothetical protein
MTILNWDISEFLSELDEILLRFYYEAECGNLDFEKLCRILIIFPNSGCT